MITWYFFLLNKRIARFINWVFTMPCRWCSLRIQFSISSSHARYTWDPFYLSQPCLQCLWTGCGLHILHGSLRWFADFLFKSLLRYFSIFNRQRLSWVVGWWNLVTLIYQMQFLFWSFTIMITDWSFSLMICLLLERVIQGVRKKLINVESNAAITNIIS